LKPAIPLATNPITLDLLRVFWPALLAAAAIAIAGAVLGAFVLLRREGLIALTLPQAVVAGAAFAMLVHPAGEHQTQSADYRLVASIVGVALALPLLAWTRYRKLDHLLPALYVASLCIPFLVIAEHGQAHLGDLQNILTGIDVAVAPIDAWRTLGVLLPCAILCAILWRRWLLLAQSPATARIATLHPVAWDLLFLFLLGAVVLMGTHAMGVIMVLALLFLPAASALPLSRRIPTALGLAVAFALLDVAAGFWLSVRLEWPFSQSVGGAGFATLLLSQIAARFVR
jgi:ABC-type Mn2+/Zn2+ transport system permease subunit